MDDAVVLSVLGAKYVHASPAPWCLAAGVMAYAPELFCRLRIVEANVNQPASDVLERIICASPKVVGFSCYIWNIDATLALCAELKMALPHVIIVLGGPEVSFCAEDILKNNKEVDYILAGEGEETFPAFLRAVFENGQVEISGLCGRGPDGTIYHGRPHISKAPVPSPLSAGYLETVKGRIAYFETSRGCPYLCAFCLSGSCGPPRYFDLDLVLPELVALSNSGAKTIKFVDRTFNANAAHANKILQFILERYGREIPHGTCFHFEIAGDILQEETFDLLEQMPMGAVQLEIGIQSFCEEALRAVNRRTNTALLASNIKRLVSMGNMHIHIDLIAGLPHEDLKTFAESFGRAYELKAQMLQLGFLKLLHGSAMRSNREAYPCKFNENAPYEVIETPWLSSSELELLRQTANAVDRVYNSGRFSLTVDYVLKASGLTPFEFFSGFGREIFKAGAGRGVSLDDFTTLLQGYCEALPGVDREELRDFLVRDRLATNSEGRIPLCLHRDDARINKVIKKLSQNPETAWHEAVRRGVALLYTNQAVCWADYIPKERNPVTGRWRLKEMPLSEILS